MKTHFSFQIRTFIIFCIIALLSPNDSVHAQTGTASDPIDELGKAHNLQSGRYHFNINGSAFQADVDNSLLTDKGWILILQYVHQAGTTPSLNVIGSGNDLPVASATPLGGNDSGDLTKWGHAGNAFLSGLGATADELRFYGQSSGHNRVVHFFTSTGVGYAKTGTGSMTGLESNFTALSGHTANLPAQSALYQSNHQNDALVNRPFYKYPEYTWRASSSRWEVDDSPNNAQNSTIHKVWIRASQPVNLNGITPAGTSNTTMISDGEIFGNAYVGKMYGTDNLIAAFGHENSATGFEFVPGFMQDSEGKVTLYSKGSLVSSPKISIGAGLYTNFGGNNIELDATTTTFHKPVTMKGRLTLLQNVVNNPSGIVFENGDTIDDDLLDAGTFGGSGTFAYYKVPNLPNIDNPGFAVMTTFVSPILKLQQSTKNYMDYTSGGFLDNHIQANGLTEINGYLHVGVKGSTAPLLNSGLPDKIDGAVAHFDGRVYISEDDTNLHQGDSSTERSWNDRTVDEWKDYLLWVEKGIVAEDIAFAVITDWPDFVFEKDYDLKSLSEVKAFIKENKHLPTMTPAAEIEEVGFSAEDMFKRTILTIEELTLHTINQEDVIKAQNKDITLLKQEVELQKKFSEELLKRLEALEKTLTK